MHLPTMQLPITAFFPQFNAVHVFPIAKPSRMCPLSCAHVSHSVTIRSPAAARRTEFHIFFDRRNPTTPKRHQHRRRAVVLCTFAFVVPFQDAQFLNPYASGLRMSRSKCVQVLRTSHGDCTLYIGATSCLRAFDQTNQQLCALIPNAISIAKSVRLQQMHR